MANEIILLLHSIMIMLFVAAALRAGKDALVASSVLCWICANLFVTQQIELFGFTVTSSDAFAIGGTVALNLVNEFYGRRVALKTIGVGFAGMIFFVIMTWFHLWYAVSTFDFARSAFDIIFTPLPRLMVASLCAYVISELCTTFFFSFLKRLTNARFLTARSTIALLLGQAIDTVLFSFIGLYGVVHSVFAVMGISFLIKVIIILFTAPLIKLMRSVVSLQPHQD